MFTLARIFSACLPWQEYFLHVYPGKNIFCMFTLARIFSACLPWQECFQNAHLGGTSSASKTATFHFEPPPPLLHTPARQRPEFFQHFSNGKNFSQPFFKGQNFFQHFFNGKNVFSAAASLAPHSDTLHTHLLVNGKNFLPARQWQEFSAPQLRQPQSAPLPSLPG